MASRFVFLGSTTKVFPYSARRGVLLPEKVRKCKSETGLCAIREETIFTFQATKVVII